MSEWSGLFAVEVSAHAAAEVGVCLPAVSPPSSKHGRPGVLRTHAEASNYPAATALAMI